MSSRLVYPFLLIIGALTLADAQSPTNIQKEIDALNRRIDHAVVKKDIVFLDRHYGADFVFTHGTGTIDSKASWLKSVARKETQFISREHDSTAVEVHDRIAIITGKLSVTRQGKEDLNKYALRYVRVYALRKKRWQLISHRTTSEWHY